MTYDITEKLDSGINTNMFKDNKYTKHYMLLIEKAKNRKLPKGQYKEHHHIIPESMGGSNDKTNKVWLTGREHALCHWALLKMTEGENRSKMSYAFNGMNAENEFQQRYHSRIITRAYERHRIEHAKVHSERMKAKNLIPWNKGGVPITEEHRENLRKAALNRPKPSAESQQKRIAKVIGQKRTDETRAKMSLAHKGKPKGPMSEEEKLKRSLTMKGKAKPEGFGDKVAERMREQFLKNNPNQREDLKKICPHCGTTSGPSGYARWHGDNCKAKLSETP